MDEVVIIFREYSSYINRVRWASDTSSCYKSSVLYIFQKLGKIG